MRKIKTYFNNLQIISMLLATIMIIIIPIINNYKFVPVGWFFIGLANFGNAKFMKEWSLIGRTWTEKNDINPKTQLTKEYSDKIFYVIAILMIILCPVAYFENIFSQNYIALLIAYIVSIVVLIILFKLTDKENNKVEIKIPEIRK